MEGSALFISRDKVDMDNGRGITQSSVVHFVEVEKRFQGLYRLRNKEEFLSLVLGNIDKVFFVIFKL